MVSLRIICIGTLKERFFKDACAEYEKRLKRFCDITILELKESQLPQKPSAADIKQSISKECERILDTLELSKRNNEYVFVCDKAGKKITSEKLAADIDSIIAMGSGSMAFVIGGSHGLNREVIARADASISFSDMTFPHQLFRVMLFEQLYRVFKLINGEKYHK